MNVHFRLLSLSSKAITVLSLPMGKQGVARLILWWVFLTTWTWEALFPTASPIFSEWLIRRRPTKSSWFVAVTWRFITRKSMTCWQSTREVKCQKSSSFTKTRARESSSKAWSGWLWSLSLKWSRPWISGPQIERQRLQRWMLSHQGPIPFSPSISRQEKKSMGSSRSKLVNWTWSILQAPKGTQRLERLARQWRRVSRLICRWQRWVTSSARLWTGNPSISRIETQS